MGKGVTVSLYLIDGEPSGIICAYLSNWTGQSIKIPRNLLDKAEERLEVSSMGIYFLFGYSEENSEDKIVYIGEADNVYRSLVKHAKEDTRTFWTEAIAFTSKDDYLTKGQIQFLEHELICISKLNPNYIVENKNNDIKSLIPEMAVSDMETYLENIKIILPIFGYYLLRPISETAINDTTTFFLEQSGLKARGKITNVGFNVLVGSELVPVAEKSLSIGYKSKRKNLLVKGIIQKSKDKYIFMKDYEFCSPSEAAAIIAGCLINGRQAWKDRSGKTLKQIEEQLFSEK